MWAAALLPSILAVPAAASASASAPLPTAFEPAADGDRLSGHAGLSGRGSLESAVYGEDNGATCR
jgi:hypothetical protein